MRALKVKRRWGGWFGFAIRLVTVLLLWVPVPVGLYAANKLSSIAKEVPELPDISVLEPTYGSRVERLDGAWIGGRFATEHVPFDDLPPEVIGAFLAAEDEDFFTHRAFNMRSIARAAMQNYQAGRTVQGGSTITQQLAKQFMGTEKSYQRKLRELLLARRLEATVPKTELLAIYLRTVFLGHTVYGVTQASWFYFERDPRELTINQAATLAGMLPAPNRFDPLRFPERSKKRRDRVLRRLQAIGALTDQELERELAKPLELPEHRRRTSEPLDPDALHSALTYFAEDEELPDKTWGEGGYTLVLPHDAIAQADARRSLLEAVHAYDRRQGWRGPLATLTVKTEDKQGFDAALARFGEEIEELDLKGPLRPGVITSAEKEEIEVFVDGQTIALPLEQISWAEPSTTERHYKRPVRLRDARRAFSRGDIVALRRRSNESEEGEGRYELVQRPIMEGAFHVMESLTGRTLASIGGIDPWQDAFHRAEQGCRQPGSVFKPIVYSEALSMRMSVATMVADTPREDVTSVYGKVWTPRNADRNFRGYITLARALASSRNIPTVSLMERVGAARVIQRARALGIETPLDPVPALALGASCVHPYQMVGVYAAFQRNGARVSTPRIETLLDRRGDVVRDEGHFAAPHLPLMQRLDRMTKPPPPRRRGSKGVSDQVAYIMWWMLRQVAIRGTAHDLPNEWNVAGKTGTTNAFDTWFMGFDGQITAGVWVGSDKNLVEFGRGEHGATVAMPAFVSFYEPRARTFPEDVEEIDKPYPAAIPEGISYHKIDLATGLLAREREPGVEYPFIDDTQPFEMAPTRGTRQAEQIDELLLDY